MGQKVAKNKVVALAFELFDTEKNLIDSATRKEPMPYIHGVGQLLPVVEQALEGKSENFSTNITVSADNAYGPYMDELVVELPRAHFPKDVDIQIGMCFNTTGPNGEPIIVEVKQVDAQKVSVDGNHPLAGMDLEYKLEIVGIRDASKEELDHGHVHGAGGHHHGDDDGHVH